MKRHLLLHYVLIMLLMMVPVRGSMAMQQTHCDTDDRVMTHHNAMDNVSMHDVSTSDATMSRVNGEIFDLDIVSVNEDCCCDSAQCISDCNMSLSVTLLFQAPSYTPNYTNTVVPVVLMSNLITIEDIPPFRPPLAFHN